MTSTDTTAAERPLIKRRHIPRLIIDGHTVTMNEFRQLDTVPLDELVATGRVRDPEDIYDDGSGLVPYVVGMTAQGVLARAVAQVPLSRPFVVLSAGTRVCRGLESITGELLTSMTSKPQVNLYVGDAVRCEHESHVSSVDGDACEPQIEASVEDLERIAEAARVHAVRTGLAVGAPSLPLLTLPA